MGTHTNMRFLLGSAMLNKVINLIFKNDIRCNSTLDRNLGYAETGLLPVRSRFCF